MQYIDSHQHFWQLSRGDYSWLTPKLTKLYRDFLPRDLQPVLKELGIDKTIVVQAAPTFAETEFLLQLAAENDFILGIVGWIDLEASDAIHHLETLKKNPRFLGIRPMLQDIADINWILKPEIQSTLKALETYGLTFDALVLPSHLPSMIYFAEKFPDLKIVIDHGAKPVIKNNIMEPWATHIQTLSHFPNVYCKLSGLITEANPLSWSDLYPYMDHLFHCFGEERIMWGSDFPVLNLASHYREWYEFCFNYLNKIGKNAVSTVFGKVAEAFYILKTDKL